MLNLIKGDFYRYSLQQVVKEVSDRMLAAILLILLSPLMGLIAVAVYLRMGRPVLFVQPRPGQSERIFHFYKFRSMTHETDLQGHLLPDHQRLTWLGQWLRRTSLDELPQLLNILKGEMSFVGPRPLLVEFLDYYTPEQSRRHQVKPGVTGWAQVNGRNTLSWMEKCALDVWYVDHHSLGLDLKILAMTIGKVLKQEGVGSSECSEISRQQLAAVKQEELLKQSLK
ncbi:MAG: sugar transferase [Elainella sp. Prado103]|jgi:lipopolysaccharide/colanic/teichoic acid biosynthesis glycosyltransferase|nr:sugar transferase [Elainella sp. Prado103]